MTADLALVVFVLAVFAMGYRIGWQRGKAKPPTRVLMAAKIVENRLMPDASRRERRAAERARR